MEDDSTSSTSSHKEISTSGSSWEQDLIRSVGSSFSVTDESDGEATQLLRDQLKKFEAALYEDGPVDGLLGDALEETKQWSRFPHLRIIGRRIDLRGRDDDGVEGERFARQDISEDEESSTLSEGSSDAGTLTLREDNKDLSSEEEHNTLYRRRRFGSERQLRAGSNTSEVQVQVQVQQGRTWYPVQVQNWIPEDILPRNPRLSPIPYESRISTASASHYNHNHHRQSSGYNEPPPAPPPAAPPPCIIRHGTLPPIDTLEITPKLLVNRCKSARLGSGCPLSRPTTSKKVIVLSPICGRSSSMKKRSANKNLTKDNSGKELKAVRNTKPTVQWKY